MINRTFIFSDDVVNERLTYIAEFIDNLQEVLLEGLSPDLDSICTYVLSAHCDAHTASAPSPSPSVSSSLSSSDAQARLTKGYREKTSSLSHTELFHIRKDDHAIDRTTNRGRSFSVNDGHMSNVVISGVDLEGIYRKVIRRQVELEVYFPCGDAVFAMMSSRFGKCDVELERSVHELVRD